METVESSFFEGFLGGILYGLTLSDFALPVGCALWLAVNSLKLSHIDYSDIITAGLYCVFSGFVGIVLVIVIPEKFHTLHSMQSFFVCFTVFFLISALRWLNLFMSYKNALLTKKKGHPDGQTRPRR